MTRYAWTALDSQGKTAQGVMEAASVEEVGQWLIDREYFVLTVEVESGLGALPLSSRARRTFRVSIHDQNYFFIQLASLINAGCPLIMSLQALHRQLPAGDLHDLVGDLKERLEMGKSLSESLRAHPEAFSNLFVTMVEVGETGGVLGEVLERYALIFESLYRIRRKVITSMIYPAFLLILTLGVTWALLWFVFPTFVQQLAARGGTLPWPTQVVIWFSDLLNAHYLKLLLFIAVVVLGILTAVRTPGGARAWSRFSLHAPVFGNLVRHVQLSLFTRTLGTLLRCQVPIITSLKAVERTLSNQVFQDALAEIRAGVARGESLSLGMTRQRHLFPESLILMADVGERSGSTGDMLDRAANIYERDLEATISTVVSLIEPALVMFMAVFVIMIAMAMYLPLFDLVSVVR